MLLLMKQWWRQKQTLSTEAKKVSIFTITFWFRGFIIGWEIVIGKCNLRFLPQGHVRFVSTLYTKLCRLWRVTRSVWNMLLSDHLWILDVHKRLRRANFPIKRWYICFLVTIMIIPRRLEIRDREHQWQERLSERNKKDGFPSPQDNR